MASSWTVTGDQPGQYSTVGTATPVLGHVISFITGLGHRGDIFIPDDQYDPKIIKPALQVKANLVDEINTLTNKS